MLSAWRTTSDARGPRRRRPRQGRTAFVAMAGETKAGATDLAALGRPRDPGSRGVPPSNSTQGGSPGTSVAISTRPDAWRRTNRHQPDANLRVIASEGPDVTLPVARRRRSGASGKRSGRGRPGAASQHGRRQRRNGRSPRQPGGYLRVARGVSSSHTTASSVGWCIDRARPRERPHGRGGMRRCTVP
jgi:hypothetical protein